MTDRKTLQLRDPSETVEAPALKKKGRGWEISEKRLDALHDRAREIWYHLFVRNDLERRNEMKPSLILAALAGTASLAAPATARQAEPYTIDYTLPMAPPMYAYAACLLDRQDESFTESERRCTGLRSELEALSETRMADFHKGQMPWRERQYRGALDLVARNVREIREGGYAVPQELVSYLSCSSSAAFDADMYRDATGVDFNTRGKECRTNAVDGLQTLSGEEAAGARRAYNRIRLRGRALTPPGFDRDTWSGHELRQGLFQLSDLQEKSPS